MTARGSDGSRGNERILLDLFRKWNSVQIKWLVRIILKDLKLGLGHETILNLVRQLPRLLNFESLGKTGTFNFVTYVGQKLV